MKKFLYRFGATLGWAALLFVLSSIPDLTFPVTVFSWDDKIQHTAAYAPLGFLLLRSLVWKNQIRRRDWWLAIVIGVIYAVSDEIHQHFVPGRTMDWTDALADTLGVTIGSSIFYQWRKRQGQT